MIHPKIGFILLFVKNPIESSAFYSTLFNLQPIEKSPTFVLFAVPDGTMLGLWSRYTAEPAVTATAGASELCFAVDDVDAIFNQCGMQGITMIQKPTEMDFGRTCVAIDPDGHRIRVYTMRKEK